MRLRTLVWREIFERKSQLATSFLAILLGITVIVSIENIRFYSEKAVSREMDSLGANVLIVEYPHHGLRSMSAMVDRMLQQPPRPPASVERDLADLHRCG